MLVLVWMNKEDKYNSLNLRYAFSVVVAVLVIISLVRMIWDNLEGLRRVKNLRNETQSLQEQNAQLKKEIEERKSLEYVEEEARRKIGMVKEGEKVFIYPDQGQVDSEENGPDYIEGELCYWREWLNAFGFSW